MRRSKPMESTKLEQTRRQFDAWREEVGGKGGRGTPIPESLWKAAVEAAHENGVGRTARALRLNSESLTKHMLGSGSQGVTSARPNFVEVSGDGFGWGRRTVLQLEGRDGERLRVDFGSENAVDLMEVVLAFWSRNG